MDDTSVKSCHRRRLLSHGAALVALGGCVAVEPKSAGFTWGRNMAGFGTHGYDTARPMWVPVPQERLATSPYSYICQISASDGYETAEGTGWLAASGKVVTAAHVLGRFTSCSLRFANEATWRPSTSIERFSTAYDESGNVRDGSDGDLAVISINDPPAGGLSVGNPGGTTVLAAGYVDGVLVEHKGTWLGVGPFMAHNSHTDHGHSGCPVIAGGTVAAVHLGLFRNSARWFKPPDNVARQYLNSAVVIDDARKIFIRI